MPITSRQECIESWGIPASTTRIPVLALSIGPIVLPHGQSLRTTNSLIGTSAMRPISRTRKPVMPFVVYLGKKRFIHPIINRTNNKAIHAINKWRQRQQEKKLEENKKGCTPRKIQITERAPTTKTYFWFEFVLMTTPPLRVGAWFASCLAE